VGGPPGEGANRGNKDPWESASFITPKNAVLNFTVYINLSQ